MLKYSQGTEELRRMRGSAPSLSPSPSLHLSLVFNKLVTQETSKLMRGLHPWQRGGRKKEKEKGRRGWMGTWGVEAALGWRRGRKREVAHGEDELTWPEFSTWPRAAVVLPLQHAVLRRVRTCVCVRFTCTCLFCASNHKTYVCVRECMLYLQVFKVRLFLFLRVHKVWMWMRMCVCTVLTRTMIYELANKTGGKVCIAHQASVYPSENIKLRGESVTHELLFIAGFSTD